jgi:hypothetical protein
LLEMLGATMAPLGRERNGGFVWARKETGHVCRATAGVWPARHWHQLGGSTNIIPGSVEWSLATTI